MTGCCPFCGAEYALSEARCWDCKLSLTESAAAPLAEDQPGDEVLYELDDWPVEARVKLTTTLAQRGIAARWEPGLTLAVLEADDEAAETALDEIEEELTDDDEDWDEGDEGDDDAGEAGEAGDRATADAVAQAAMGDLFVAADRLMHEPADDDLATDLAEAASVVDGSAPPFGVEPGLWDKVRELSAVVRGDVEVGADDEVVAQDARTLRDVLRPYI